MNQILRNLLFSGGKVQTTPHILTSLDSLALCLPLKKIQNLQSDRSTLEEFYARDAHLLQSVLSRSIWPGLVMADHNWFVVVSPRDVAMAGS